MRTWKKTLGLLAILTMLVTVLTFVSTAAEPGMPGAPQGDGEPQTYGSSELPPENLADGFEVTVTVDGQEFTVGKLGEFEESLEIEVDYGTDFNDLEMEAYALYEEGTDINRVPTLYQINELEEWTEEPVAGFYPAGSTCTIRVISDENIGIFIKDITFTVVKRPLTISVQDQEIVYGKAYASEGEDALQVTGLVEGHTFATKVVTDGTDGKNAGTHTLKLDGEPKITAAGNIEVTGNYQITIENAKGELTVQKRPITLVAASETKEFDGTPLTAASYALVDNRTPIEIPQEELDGLNYEPANKERDLFDGTKLTATVNGSVTYVGTVENVVEDFEASANFDIHTIPGELEITDRENKYTVTLTGASAEKVYDGEELMVNGLSEEKEPILEYNGTEYDGDVEGDSVTFTTFEDGPVFKVAYPQIACEQADVLWKEGDDGKEVDSYSVGDKESVEKGATVTLDGEDVTEQFEIGYTPGELTINPRPITLVAESAEKEFDGALLTAASYALVDNRMPDQISEQELDGLNYEPADIERKLIDGTKLTATVEGSERYVKDDATANTVTSIKLNGEDYKPDGNFIIATKNGELRVTDRKNKYTITLTGASTEVVYDGEEHTAGGLATAVMEGAEFDSPLPATEDGKVTFTLEGTPFTLAYQGVSRSARDAGTYTVSEDVEAAVKAMTITIGDEAVDVKEQFNIEFTSGELIINPRPVYVQATGSKGFGTADPEFTVMPLDPTEENPDSGMAPDESFEEKIDYGTLKRADGEQIGKYAIVPAPGNDLSEGPVQQGNYLVHFLPTQTDADGQITGGSYFEITGEINWSVGIEPVGEELDSHDAKMTVTVTPDEGVTLLDLSLFRENVAPSVTVADWKPMDGVEYKGYDTISISAGDFTEQDGRYALTVSIPQVEYTTTDPFDGGPLTWASYLQAGTTVTVTIGTGDGTAVANAEKQSTTVDVESVEAEINFNFTAGSGIVFESGDSRMVDENGVITVSASESVADTDVIAVTAGEVTKYYTYSDLKNGVLTRTEILRLTEAAEGVNWCNPNPTGSLNISAALVDDVNHAAEEIQSGIAFDMGAVASEQTVGNRPGEAALVLELKDTVREIVGVTGTFGESIPSVQMANDGLTWVNVGEWKNHPATLPHSGDVITVEFRDRVGHTVTHTIHVVRSQAATGLSIGVKPMEDNTVPNSMLRFEGDANVWEDLILTVGGRTYALDALGGNAVYDNSTRSWQYSIRLADIDGFPVGIPTTISIAYADLSGGEASITITYKDHVDAPALGSELIVGSDVIWGFVEQGATRVLIDIVRANGEREGVALVALEAGYFCSEVLDTPLGEGDSVEIRVEDFCGNIERVTLPVANELREPAVAEVLGASFTGEVAGEMAHRFATPIDLASLSAREDKTMTLPILAYKGIEIGTVTVTLTEDGTLDASYEIAYPNMLAQGAQARARVYQEKPQFADLLAAQDVVTDDLYAAPSGSLVRFSAANAGYRTAEGYTGVVWLCAQFDIDMDEESYVNLGGRGVSFYRWLDEQSDANDMNGQSFELIGRVYSESSSYAMNRMYYDLYRSFEHISANT